ncbi:uncharacterized protein V1510DRAFT_415142 [Dipodascopsis tothii]|uniref:uncharacterized protein n=1 Tax=Dipodascopsis tothii TaxID=44089 RepID=UPI0034CD0C8D
MLATTSVRSRPAPLASACRLLSTGPEAVRLSKLFVPSGTVSSRQGKPETTTELLVRAGYMRQSSAGVFQMLPLGLRVERKITEIIHRHMQQAGASEVALPSLLTAAAWKETGRWANKEMYKLKDSGGGEFCLGPTHEEEITTLVAHEVSSWKQLPLRLYQIGRKFRDELRPRGGLLRGREFTMMDLYSFDRTAEDALATYEVVRRAYDGALGEIGVDYVVCEADGGDIGGSVTHEYHYVTDAGEDALLRCDSCGYAANSEVALSYPPADYAPAFKEAAVKYGVSRDRDTLIVAYYPPDRKLSPTLLKQLAPDWDPAVADKDVVAALQSTGDAMTKSVLRLFDARVTTTVDLPDMPVATQRSNTTTVMDACLVEADPASHGDMCGSCDDGALTSTRAVEVGHTFYLGTKYSKPLAASYTPRNGAARVPIEMGCYGIGVSRLIAAVAEKTRDAKGLAWPAAIAPFSVVVVTRPGADSADIERAAVRLCQQLRDRGIDAIVDDRADKSFGWKLGDARYLGFPVCVVVGNKFVADGVLDVEVRRTGAAHAAPSVDAATDLVCDVLRAEHAHVWP